MSVLKADIRADVLHEIGVMVDDQLDAARAECFRLDGAKQAMAQVASKIEQHTKHVDATVDRGEISLEEAGRQKKRILECIGITQNLGLGAEINHHVARGRVEALERVIARIKKESDAAKQRARDLREAETVKMTTMPKRAPRLVGTRPVSLVAERKKKADEPNT